MILAVFGWLRFIHSAVFERLRRAVLRQKILKNKTCQSNVGPSEWVNDGGVLVLIRKLYTVRSV